MLFQPRLSCPLAYIKCHIQQLLHNYAAPKKKWYGSLWLRNMDGMSWFKHKKRDAQVPGSKFSYIFYILNDVAKQIVYVNFANNITCCAFKSNDSAKSPDCTRVVKMHIFHFSKNTLPN
jgi:hypothetical protein